MDFTFVILAFYILSCLDQTLGSQASPRPVVVLSRSGYANILQHGLKINPEARLAHGLVPEARNISLLASNNNRLLDCYETTIGERSVNIFSEKIGDIMFLFMVYFFLTPDILSTSNLQNYNQYYRQCRVLFFILFNIYYFFYHQKKYHHLIEDAKDTKQVINNIIENIMSLAKNVIKCVFENKKGKVTKLGVTPFFIMVCKICFISV